MRAVMSSVPPEIVAWRRKTGADQWDEMWEGVLHMTPMPNRDHQDLEWALETWLRLHWARPQGCKVYHEVNLTRPGGWPDDYRIPDLLLLTPQRLAIDKNTYFEGAPDAVVEIRSPDDESYEKLAWYASLGVPEVWIIERDSKVPELHRLRAGQYVVASPDADGWLVSGLGISLRAARPGTVEISLAGDPSTLEQLP